MYPNLYILKIENIELKQILIPQENTAVLSMDWSQTPENYFIVVGNINSCFVNYSIYL